MHTYHTQINSAENHHMKMLLVQTDWLKFTNKCYTWIKVWGHLHAQNCTNVIFINDKTHFYVIHLDYNIWVI